MEHFDVIGLGAGSACAAMARRLAGPGLSVAVWIGEAVPAIHAGIPLATLAEVVHLFPTSSEAYGPMVPDLGRPGGGVTAGRRGEERLMRRPGACVARLRAGKRHHPQPGPGSGERHFGRCRQAMEGTHA